MFHLAAESESSDIGTAIKRTVIAGCKIRTVYGIPSHLCKCRAAPKRPFSNACHAVSYAGFCKCGTSEERLALYTFHIVGYDNFCKGTVGKCRFSNAIHALGYGYLRECGAAVERIVSNACHAVSRAVVAYGFGNAYDAGQGTVIVGIPLIFIRNFHGPGGLVSNVVAQIAAFEIVRPCACCRQQGKGKSE